MLVAIVLLAGLLDTTPAWRLIDHGREVRTTLPPLLGVLAPLASHILWTGAMLAWPPAVAGTEGNG